MKAKLQILIFLLFVISHLVICKTDSKTYFQNFDLYLKGVVIHTEYHNSSSYINCLEIDSSNYEIFDQRDSLNTFFTVKRHNFAVFYGNDDIRSRYEFELGDSVEIFGNEKRLTCKDSTGKFKFERMPLTITDRFFFPLTRINEIIYEYETGKRNLTKSGLE